MYYIQICIKKATKMLIYFSKKYVLILKYKYVENAVLFCYNKKCKYYVNIIIYKIMHNIKYNGKMLIYKPI